LKNYFLAIFPPDECAAEIFKSRQKIEGPFDSLDIPVRWTLENHLHISILFFGNDLNFLQLFMIKRKIAKFHIEKPFEVSFSSPKIGISNRYHELIYLPVEQGAEELRELLLSISNQLHFTRDHSFIPHLTLGRVSKDLSDQEFRNIKHEVERNENSDANVNCVFKVEHLYLVESDLETYTILSAV
jgi:2'-5' RNA ligase